MTRHTEGSGVVSIRRSPTRPGRYVVASRHGVIENTWQLSWALYRFTCCM